MRCPHAVFKRLTIEEARTLSRDELMPRIDAEMSYWVRKPSGVRPRGFEEFQAIMRAAVDPGKALSETRALVEGRPMDSR